MFKYLAAIFVFLAVSVAAAWAVDSNFAYPFISAAGTNCSVIVAGSTTLQGFSLGSTTTTPRYIKFYNQATAPTAGQASPAPYPFEIPGSSSSVGGGSNVTPALGLLFNVGLSFCVTGSAANSDTTAIQSGDVVGTIFYH
jgi:hypothetical protein